MKIVFLLRSLTLSGGIERVFVDKANWLAEQGHDVLFLTLEQGAHSLSFALNSLVEYRDLDCRYFTLYRYGIFKRLIKTVQMKCRFYKRL